MIGDKSGKPEKPVQGDVVENWAKAAASFAGVCREIGFSEQDMDGVYGLVKKMGFLFAKRSLSSASLFLHHTAASFEERGLEGSAFYEQGAKYASFRNGAWQHRDDASLFAPEALTWARRRFFLSPVGSAQEAEEARNMKRALEQIEEKGFYDALSETVRFASRLSWGRKEALPLAMGWLVEQAGRQSEKALRVEGDDAGRIKADRGPGLWKEAVVLARDDPEKRGVFLNAWADSVRIWGLIEPEGARRFLAQEDEKDPVFLAAAKGLSLEMKALPRPSGPVATRAVRAARSFLRV